MSSHSFLRVIAGFVGRHEVDSAYPATTRLSGAMIKQFSNVSGLYAWLMSSSGLVPVPFPRSTWEDLGISEFPEAGNLDLAPNKRRDTRRSVTTRRY